MKPLLAKLIMVSQWLGAAARRPWSCAARYQSFVPAGHLGNLEPLVGGRKVQAALPDEYCHPRAGNAVDE